MPPAPPRQCPQKPPPRGAGPGPWFVAVAVLAAGVAAAGNGRHTVEGGLKFYDLSNGQPITRGGYLTTRLNPEGADKWLAEAVYLERFDDTGTFAGVTNTHDWSPGWYSTQGVGTSSGGFFWPRLRLDATLNRRSKSVPGLVTTVGAGYVDYKDVHSDRYLSLGLSYYLHSPWVVQGTVTVNESDPGSVTSETYTVAVTHGREGERLVSLRLSTGRQSYVAVGPTDFQVDFPFRGLRLDWQEWVEPQWGFRLVGDLYRSDPYDHWGVEVGVFHHF